MSSHSPDHARGAACSASRASGAAIPASPVVVPEFAVVIPASPVVVTASAIVITASAIVIPASPVVVPAKAGIHLPTTLSIALLLLLLVATGCEREQRSFRTAPPGSAPTGIVRMSSIIPGPPMSVDSVLGPYGDNAYAVSEGQRLFSYFNCTGCHSNGGGGMGPPLMDDEWVYGSSPRNIFSSIVQGRPNGMPSWGGRIGDDDVWKLVAYVRSLSGLTPSGTRSSRTDHMMMKPGSQSLMQPEKPKSSSVPPAAIMP